MSNDNTPEMNTTPMMRRQTMAGADETLPLLPLPTSPLMRQRAVPTETVSDGELDLSGGALGSVRALLEERITAWAADISGGKHPFIRPSLPQEPRRFNGLSERDGYADYVETAYRAARRGGVIADLAAVPSLVGVPITEIDRLVGGDIVGRIRAVMSRFTPDYGTNLYYGALVHLVNAAKEDMAAAAAAGVEEESDVDSDNEGDGHEVSGAGGDEDEALPAVLGGSDPSLREGEDADEDEDEEEDEEGTDADEEDSDEDSDEDEDESATDADDEGGDVEPVPAPEPAPPRRADNILDMPVAIELPVWGWVAVLAVFVAWAAFVNMALSRDLGVRVRPF